MTFHNGETNNLYAGNVLSKSLFSIYIDLIVSDVRKCPTLRGINSQTVSWVGALEDF